MILTDRETRVKPELVRHKGGKKSSSPSKSSSRRRREGDEVEARIRGRWTRGKVDRVNRDSYDVDVDGRLHRDVPEDDVRELAGRDRDRDRDSDAGGDDEFKEGMKVEARYKGRSRWFPATIKFIRRDGTMDLLYDDGGECGVILCVCVLVCVCVFVRVFLMDW